MLDIHFWGYEKILDNILRYQYWYTYYCWIGGKTNTKQKKTKPAKVVEVIESGDESEDEGVIRKLVENSKIFWD